MKTNHNEIEQKIKKAADVIKQGGLVLFPTETVYGIGANGLDDKAVKKIFVAKGRAQDNPLILHIAGKDMLKMVATDITPMEQKLMDAFWPGPFTIILKRTKQVPDGVTAGLETVGIRMPSHPIARELIQKAGVPIAAPSANISGRPSGTRLEDIIEELKDKVDAILDGGESQIGLESTVIRVIDEVPHILRPGKVTPKDLEKIAGKVKIDPHILGKLEEGQKVLSPGMKYRHYAPKARCVLVYSKDNEKKVEKIQEFMKKYKKVVVLCCTENQDKYPGAIVINMGHQKNLEEISKNIFQDLRKVDQYEPEIVLIEGTTKEGLGLAIMNRLLRACEYQYIEI